MNQANFLLGYEVTTMIIVLDTTKEKSLGINFNQDNWMLVLNLALVCITSPKNLIDLTFNNAITQLSKKEKKIALHTFYFFIKPLYEPSECPLLPSEASTLPYLLLLVCPLANG